MMITVPSTQHITAWGYPLKMQFHSHTCAWCWTLAVQA